MFVDSASCNHVKWEGGFRYLYYEILECIPSVICRWKLMYHMNFMLLWSS